MCSTALEYGAHLTERGRFIHGLEAFTTQEPAASSPLARYAVRCLGSRIDRQSEDVSAGAVHARIEGVKLYPVLRRVVHVLTHILRP